MKMTQVFITPVAEAPLVFEHGSWKLNAKSISFF